MNIYQGRQILITAASQRTGRAMATYLAKNGATVHAVYHSSHAAAAELVKEVGAERVKIYSCAVDHPEDVRALFQKIQQQTAHLDGLINVVGDYQEGPVGNTSYDEWQQLIRNNLDSVFLMCQSFYPLLKQAGGARVINFSYTNAGRIAPTRCPAYHIAKTGVLILSKTLAAEWGPDRISVNVISPGTLSNSIIKQSETAADYIPQGRFGEYTDLFPVLDLIFRKDSEYLSGNNFKISGAYNI